MKADGTKLLFDFQKLFHERPLGNSNDIKYNLTEISLIQENDKSTHVLLTLIFLSVLSASLVLQWDWYAYMSQLIFLFQWIHSTGLLLGFRFFKC